MSKEKKLSKDGLMDEIMLAMNSAVAIAHQQYPFREARITQAREQIRQLIESPDKHTSAILDELHEVRMKNAELRELIEAYRYPGSHKSAESNEAELREFVEKWNQIIAERVNVQMKKDFIREEISLVYPGTDNLTQMLKEAGMEVVGK